MTDYWFKPKTHGYGATPSNWKGWAVTLIAIALIVAATKLVIVDPQAAGVPPSFEAFSIWAAAIAAITAVLVWISRAKTDGEWKWRWGQKHN